MSRRQTLVTEINNKAILTQAAKTAGIHFVEVGRNTVRFTTGTLNGAVLDLDTGRIDGDSDYGHTTETLGMLRQTYGEALYRDECMRQGISIESRQVEPNGEVILMCSQG
jgi:hypothetical protein